jgi:signal transduction histidine kinase
VHANRYAAIVAVTYAVTAGAYVATAVRVATHVSLPVDELLGVEMLAGLCFVVVTTGLWFLLASSLMRRIERQDGVLAAADRRALSGLLASAVAHDFRNVLQVADGFTALALEADDQDDARESLVKVRAALARGNNLARQLSQAGRDAAVGEKRSVSLGALVVDCIELLRVNSNAKSARIEAHVETPLEACVHPAAIRQVVTNLVLNATEAAPRGRVRIDLSRDGRDVLLVVDDDGPGVDEREQQRIFDPFYSTKPAGTGLGLFAVRAAVKLHDGAVAVARGPLGGARFIVRLPGAVANPGGMAPAKAPALPKASGAPDVGPAAATSR